MKRAYSANSTLKNEYVPGLSKKERIVKMAKRTSKLETILTENTETTNTYVDALTAAPKKPAAKKATAKTEPAKELDWHAVGMVKAHQSAKARAIRKIDRIKAQYIYNVASAFLIGLAVGVMLTTWLH
jgi:hypothetical protein